jgi:hypothetical protein
VAAPAMQRGQCSSGLNFSGSTVQYSARRPQAKQGEAKERTEPGHAPRQYRAVHTCVGRRRQLVQQLQALLKQGGLAGGQARRLQMWGAEAEQNIKQARCGNPKKVPKARPRGQPSGVGAKRQSGSRAQSQAVALARTGAQMSPLWP